VGKTRREPKRPKRRDVHERALGLLAVRARSRRELERRLRQAGFEPDAVDEEIARLEQVGLIDDQAFARQLAEHAFGAGGRGRRAVAFALAAKGVDASLAAVTMDEFDHHEDERALEVARARAARMTGIEPTKAFQRLSGLLMRRGFAPETSRSAARTALALEERADE
jgi:regulatory protein